MVNSVLVLLVLEVVLHVPVTLTVTGENFLRLSVLYVDSSVPFFLTGLLFSVVFARETWRVPRLYGADLSGGALACLAVVPLLNWVGGPNTILAAAVAMAAAAMVWASSSTARKVAGCLAVFFVLLIAANHSGRLIDVVYAKGRFRNPRWVEFARWNALARVEVGDGQRGVYRRSWGSAGARQRAEWNGIRAWRTLARACRERHT